MSKDLIAKYLVIPFELSKWKIICYHIFYFKFTFIDCKFDIRCVCDWDVDEFDVELSIDIVVEFDVDEIDEVVILL